MFGAPIVELMRAPTLHAEDGYLIKTPKGFTNSDVKNSPPVDNLLVQPLGNYLGCGSAGRPCLDQNVRLA